MLADELARELGEVLRACRHHRALLHKWGMARRLATGRGVVALFDGPPGTGKTLACEVLAHELDRPMQRIQLAQVISKWVGETEKHIQGIFKEARSSSSILLFDEADALFGERVSVSSAQDRFANMETNQLLSEIERFDGIVFLTTNLEAHLDQAFKRRIQYRVTFKEPEMDERRRIWERLIPEWLPRHEELDCWVLAEAFELSGGHIKNAIMRACFIALDAGRGLCNEDLVEAGKAECKMAGRLFRADVLRDDDF